MLFSTDQSFPLAGAFAYSVYQFQSKRVKRDPEGPFFGGNAIVGAIFSTLCCLAIACGVSVVLPECLTVVLPACLIAVLLDCLSGVLLHGSVCSVLTSPTAEHRSAPFKLCGGCVFSRRCFSLTCLYGITLFGSRLPFGLVACCVNCGLLCTLWLRQPAGLLIPQGLLLQCLPLTRMHCHVPHYLLQVMAVLTTPLTAILGQSTRQVGGFITIAVMGAVGIYLK